MAAFANACLLQRRSAAGALLATTLLACSAPHRPQPILGERCLAVGTAMPITVRIRAPASGAVRIAVRQRGISLTAALIDGGASSRHGLAGRSLRRDDFSCEPPAGGAAIRCASSRAIRLISPVRPASRRRNSTTRTRSRLVAERAFAAAGRATSARRWQSAFDDYLVAARGFDHVDRRALRRGAPGDGAHRLPAAGSQSRQLRTGGARSGGLCTRRRSGHAQRIAATAGGHHRGVQARAPRYASRARPATAQSLRRTCQTSAFWGTRACAADDSARLPGVYDRRFARRRRDLHAGRGAVHGAARWGVLRARPHEWRRDRGRSRQQRDCAARLCRRAANFEPGGRAGTDGDHLGQSRPVAGLPRPLQFGRADRN